MAAENFLGVRRTRVIEVDEWCKVTMRPLAVPAGHGAVAGLPWATLATISYVGIQWAK